MTIPRWSTVGVFVVLVIQFILSWLRATKTGKSFRAAVLPDALIALAVSMLFVRAFFGDLPVWIDAPIAFICGLVILFLIALAAVRLKRYVTEAWRLEGKTDH